MSQAIIEKNNIIKSILKNRKKTYFVEQAHDIFMVLNEPFRKFELLLSVMKHTRVKHFSQTAPSSFLPESRQWSGTVAPLHPRRIVDSLDLTQAESPRVELEIEQVVGSVPVQVESPPLFCWRGHVGNGLLDLPIQVERQSFWREEQSRRGFLCQKSVSF